MNVFEYRKYKEHEDKIHMIISKYFPYTASMTEQFFNDAEFNEIYLKHYHYCFFKGYGLQRKRMYCVLSV